VNGARRPQPARAHSAEAGHHGVNPFAVPVGQLRRSPGKTRQVTVHGPLPDLVVTASRVPGGADVVVEGTLQSMPGGLALTGTVTAPWVGACRRCAGEAVGVLRVPVRERFAPGGDGDDAYPLADDVADLAPVARDAVLLELPPAPLCAQTCRGLCPECGADLNVDPCGGHARRDGRWAALAALRQAGSGTREG
jgi:uncharacterized protein